MTRSQPSRSVPSRLLSAFRIGLGLLFTSQGGHWLFAPGVSGAARWVALIQLVAGALVMLGVRSRPAALVCAAVTGYAFVALPGAAVLWPVRDGAEAVALFCWGLLLIAAYGPGAWTAQGWLAPESPRPALGSDWPDTVPADWPENNWPAA